MYTFKDEPWDYWPPGREPRDYFGTRSKKGRSRSIQRRPRTIAHIELTVERQSTRPSLYWRCVLAYGRALWFVLKVLAVIVLSGICTAISAFAALVLKALLFG